MKCRFKQINVYVTALLILLTATLPHASFRSEDDTHCSCCSEDGCRCECKTGADLSEHALGMRGLTQKADIDFHTCNGCTTCVLEKNVLFNVVNLKKKVSPGIVRILKTDRDYKAGTIDKAVIIYALALNPPQCYLLKKAFLL